MRKISWDCDYASTSSSHCWCELMEKDSRFKGSCLCRFALMGECLYPAKGNPHLTIGGVPIEACK